MLERVCWGSDPGVAVVHDEAGDDDDGILRLASLLVCTCTCICSVRRRRRRRGSCRRDCLAVQSDRRARLPKRCICSTPGKSSNLGSRDYLVDKKGVQKGVRTKAGALARQPGKMSRARPKTETQHFSRHRPPIYSRAICAHRRQAVRSLIFILVLILTLPILTLVSHHFHLVLVQASSRTRWCMSCRCRCSSTAMNPRPSHISPVDGKCLVATLYVPTQ
ncbi:hypothetical protein V8C42DRAFT_159571 [Trichoderma barbatum]